MPLIYHCSPYHKDSALHPVISQLLRAAGIERDDSAEAKVGKLETLLAQSPWRICRYSRRYFRYLAAAVIRRQILLPSGLGNAHQMRSLGN
jgi:hypothetical protein